MNLLIKNAKLLQFYPAKVGGETDIFIQGEEIRKLGKDLEKELNGVRLDKIIEAGGKYIIPGNVCAHNHFYSALARGVQANIGASYDFVGILQNLWWRLDRALDESSLYYSGLIASLEAIKAGTTSVVDHNASPSFIKGSSKILKNAFNKCGLRGILCYEVTDRNGLKDRDRGIEENVEFIKLEETDLIKGSVGAHAPFTLGEESLKLLAGAVEETQRGIHIHVAEDKYELSYSHHNYGMSAVERLEKFNLLNKKSLIIHGVHILDKDVEILNDYNSFLVHNPKSNMNNNVGYNSKLMKLKNVAIGTDGIGSDMFEETKFGYFKSNDAGLKTAPTDFMRFLYNGNRVMEIYFGKKIGRIEPGFAADLVILDYINPTPLINDNTGGHFLFGLSSQAVETVIINGNCVYENREFPFEVKLIYKEACKEASRMWKEIDKFFSMNHTTREGLYVK